METELSRTINKMFNGGIYSVDYCFICKKRTRKFIVGSSITSIIISKCLECEKQNLSNKEGE